MVELSCPVTGCTYVVNGMNKEDVLAQVERHRKLAHGRKEMTEDVSPEFRRRSVK
ncbi:hypothetical protein MCP_2121 [Methanocella paludicola SANAE]|uniref:DUF1059 domain-containing protein n=1 Tax=Methanocella paludicola (strain DSM 17711 / JCM 13418 / NBRC 101707 / SANAE) TaxID=304371 RepID=D1Z0H1_METPS|nr:DUF1059 domain-containing protein [Methanocella paludicola]BAI62193.1 hypothetical protein MCP_2121 [Methanocella paludicola SANAE]